MIALLFGNGNNNNNNVCEANVVKDLFMFRYGYNVISAAANESAIKVYEIKRGNFSVKISNYGATVVSVILPDKNGTRLLFWFLFQFYLFMYVDFIDWSETLFVCLCVCFCFTGKLDDVVLGFESMDDYKVSFISLPYFLHFSISYYYWSRSRIHQFWFNTHFKLSIPSLSSGYCGNI